LENGEVRLHVAEKAKIDSVISIRKK